MMPSLLFVYRKNNKAWSFWCNGNRLISSSMAIAQWASLDFVAVGYFCVGMVFNDLRKKSYSLLIQD
jgi:hypothetical protein